MKRMTASLLTLALLAPAAAAAPPKDDYPVSMAVVAAKPDPEGRQRLVVKLTLQEGYHLHANPTENENLVPSCVVKVTGKGVKVAYPKGELVEDEVLGGYRIYRGQVNITAVVKRTQGDRQPLLVTARVRPFKEGGCPCLCRTRNLKQEVP